MKKRLLVLICATLALFVLGGCKGSKAIQGTWKASDAQGQSIELEVAEKKITIDGEEHDYKQHAIGTVNGISYHTIALDGDESQYMSFVFPEKEDKDIAVVIHTKDLDEPLEGRIILALDREETPDYQEYAEKYGK